MYLHSAGHPIMTLTFISFGERLIHVSGKFFDSFEVKFIFNKWNLIMKSKRPCKFTEFNLLSQSITLLGCIFYSDRLTSHAKTNLAPDYVREGGIKT